MDEHHCLGELCSCPAGRPFLWVCTSWSTDGQGDTEQQSRWQEETQLAGSPAGRQGGFSWELGLEGQGKIQGMPPVDGVAGTGEHPSDTQLQDARCAAGLGIHAPPWASG